MPHLTIPQLTLLIAIALAAGLVLVLLVYLIHRAVRRYKSEADFRVKSPRVENEPAFVAATLQGVIADLKQQQRNLEARCRSAEERAQWALRALEAMSAEISEGVMVVSREGYVTMANPRARELLQADFWSRRRYPEVLGSASPLTEHIRRCFESGQVSREEIIEPSTAFGIKRRVSLTVAPVVTPQSQMDGVVCLLREVGPSAGGPANS